MSQTLTRPSSRSSRRSPWTVKAAIAAVSLLALVSSYGAIYFSMFYADVDPGIGSYVFVTLFVAANITALVSATVLRTGSRRAWQVLLGWSGAAALFTLVKLVFFHESDAVVFGVVTAIVVTLLTAPRTRAFLH
jgi:hypothetical protein